jgi:hypothetical protein
MLKDGELKKLPYDRFDDIWAGVWLNNHREWDEHIYTGEPFVVHNKASNAWRNRVKEEPGLSQGNELFAEFASHGGEFHSPPENYWRLLADAYKTWYELFVEDV